MNIRKSFLTIVAASAIGSLSSLGFAAPAPDTCKADDAMITSSTLTSNGWYVSGACLQKVTNVALANDDGAGFQNLTFVQVKNPNNPNAQTSLFISGVTRTGFAEGGIPLGQYLLQIKSCQNVLAADKCKVLDEKYLVVPVGVIGPPSI